MACLNKSKLAKFSVAVDRDLLELARSIVRVTPGESLVGIVRRGFIAELTKIKKKRGWLGPKLVNTRLSPGRKKEMYSLTQERELAELKKDQP